MNLFESVKKKKLHFIQPIRYYKLNLNKNTFCSHVIITIIIFGNLHQNIYKKKKKIAVTINNIYIVYFLNIISNIYIVSKMFITPLFLHEIFNIRINI